MTLPLSARFFILTRKIYNRMYHDDDDDDVAVLLLLLVIDGVECTYYGMVVIGDDYFVT